MPLNPGNFLFPIQNLGPDLGKFFEGYNTQQKRGEERAASMQPALGERGKAIQDMQSIEQAYGPNSKEFQLAQQYYARKAEGNPGMELSFDPATGAMSFSQGGRSGGNKQQSFYSTTDEQGNPTVVTPLSAANVSQQQQKSIANFTRNLQEPLVDTPYVGQTAGARLAFDLASYAATGSKEAKERLKKHYIAHMVIPEFVSNTLSAQGTPDTVSSREHALKSLTSSQPYFNERYIESFPTDIVKEAREEHNHAVQDIANKVNEYNIKGQPQIIKKSEPKEDYRAKKAFDKNKEAPDEQRIFEISRKHGVSEQDIFDTLEAGYTLDQIDKKLSQRGNR